MMKKLILLMMLTVLLSAFIINANAVNIADVVGSDLNKQSKKLSYLTTGFVNGNVTDCNTGSGISNVLVIADFGIYHYETETDQYGNYDIVAEAGTYNIHYELLGYQTIIKYSIIVISSNTITENVQLCVNANPVSNVVADPDFNCPGVSVSWDWPQGPYTIIYDDNSAEDYFYWSQAGGEVAVKFTPDFYPATITGGKIFVGDGSIPVGGSWLGTSLEIGIYDDDGISGMPGSILEQDTIIADNYNWIHFDSIFSSIVSEGSFYVYYKQLHASPNAAPVGIDTDLPTSYKSYTKQLNGSWSLSASQDFMIRAELFGHPSNPSKFLLSGNETNNSNSTRNSRSLDKYNLYLMSGFSPDNGDGPEDGSATSIGFSPVGSHYDNIYKSPGFYAYAVEAEYDNGDKSPWAYSNIFSCGLDNVVDLKVGLCDGSQADNVEFHAIGTNFPYQDIVLMSDDSGLVVFDSLINGDYNIELFKIGYKKVILNHVLIDSDSSLTVELYENTFAPRNLFVDSLTSVATWQPALVTALETEDFEGELFPPEGWYQTIELADLSWWQRTNYEPDIVPPQFEDGTSSWFAAGKKKESVHSGTSYLVTPNVDLRVSDSLYLTFDVFTDGSYGDIARIYYSYNNGLDWMLLAELNPALEWINKSIDLSAISGIENGHDSVVFAFSNNADGYSYFCVDNVSVHNGTADVMGYDVYLNDGFVGSTDPDTLAYDFNNLVFGTEYTAKVRAVYSCGISDPISFTWTSSFLYPPRNLNHDYSYNTDEVLLKWNPPLTQSSLPLNNSQSGDMAYDFVNNLGRMPAFNASSNQSGFRSVDINSGTTTLHGAIGSPGNTQMATIAFINGDCCGSVMPEGLLSFNIYRNDEFIGSQTYGGQASDEYVSYIDNNLEPGTYLYEVSAVYDLSTFGFPGETAESMMSNIDAVKVVWGNTMPFFEGWDNGTFEFQGWETTSANWKINNAQANDARSAEFNWQPQLDTSYSKMLVSAPINADMINVGRIFLDLDIKLDDRNASSTENMMIQIQKSGEPNWLSIDTLYNNGSFDFTHKHYDITSKSLNNVFRIRFVASGENSFNIISWYIDNISIARTCASPNGINAVYFWDSDDDYGISVCWETPQIPSYYLHWDDGVVFSGIGLDSGGEFTAAVRWDAEMLTGYDGLYVTKIMFRLFDSGFQKITVKVWEGPNATSLLAEKLITSAVVSDLNTVVLDIPVPVDVNKELWVGYTILQDNASFAAGVDAGPAISGYGDKISLDGTAWDDLADFGLDYNWNIGVQLEEVDQKYPKHIILQSPRQTADNKANVVVRSIIENTRSQSPPAERSFEGFNVYSKVGDNADYEFLDFVPFVDMQTSYCYNLQAENEVQTGKCYFFQVTAVFSSATDMCESMPGLTAEGDDYTFACVTKIGELPVSRINMFPNPASNTVNINSIANINRITVTNYFGQIIKDIKYPKRTSVILNTSPFPKGVYLVQIDTDNGVQTKKLSIAR